MGELSTHSPPLTRRGAGAGGGAVWCVAYDYSRALVVRARRSRAIQIADSTPL
jgi:hypothetical protein